MGTEMSFLPLDFRSVTRRTLPSEMSFLRVSITCSEATSMRSVQELESEDSVPVEEPAPAEVPAPVEPLADAPWDVFSGCAQALSSGDELGLGCCDMMATFLL